MTTWRAEIAAEMAKHHDPGLIVATAPSNDVLDIEFDGGYGGSEGPRFTAWTEQRVYFPVVYDGAEWAGSAPRNPCNEPTAHQGGE